MRQLICCILCSGEFLRRVVVLMSPYRTLLESLCDDGLVEEVVEVLEKVLLKGLRAPKRYFRQLDLSQFYDKDDVKALINDSLMRGGVRSSDGYMAMAVDLYLEGNIGEGDKVMDLRRNIPPGYEEHSRMMRRGPLPPTHHPMEPLPPPELLENKMASQAAEIEQLTMDNRKLAASYLGLRQDLSTAKGEAEKIREHIRSIQNEGDIKIRILLDKIAKTDSDIGAADTIKKELQAAHSEARKLMTDKLELSVKVEQATKELDYSREDIKKIPEMCSEIDSLMQEYQMLRETFEHEKGTNVDKVEQMKILEEDLIGIVEEVERLRAEVLNAEKRASGSIPYMNPENRYPIPYHGSGGYTNRGAVAVEMANPSANASGGWGGDHSSTSQAVEGEVMSGKN